MKTDWLQTDSQTENRLIHRLFTDWFWFKMNRYVNPITDWFQTEKQTALFHSVFRMINRLKTVCFSHSENSLFNFFWEGKKLPIHYFFLSMYYTIWILPIQQIWNCRKKTWISGHFEFQNESSWMSKGKHPWSLYRFFPGLNLRFERKNMKKPCFFFFQKNQ